MADSKQIQPVYALVGTDSFLQDTHRKEILAKVVADADPQTCVSVFDAEAELAEVLDALRTGGLLAPRRAIVVRGADGFIAKYRSQLEDYVQAPAATGVLILLLDSLPSNTRLYKAIKKAGGIRDCKAAQARDLPPRLIAIARNHEAEMTPQAAGILVETVGTDLAQLSQEIAKLATYVGPGGKITPKEIAELVASSAGPKAFALTNALTEADANAALKALSAMLATRGEEFRALGMIAWHLRKALRAADMRARGMAPGQICRELKLPRFQQQAMMGLLNRRSVGQFHEDFRRLLRTDLAMKSGTAPLSAMRDLVVALCI